MHVRLWFLGPTEVHIPNGSLDRFIRFCKARQCVNTDRHTDDGTLATTGRILGYA